MPVCTLGSAKMYVNVIEKTIIICKRRENLGSLINLKQQLNQLGGGGGDFVGVHRDRRFKFAIPVSQPHDQI